MTSYSWKLFVTHDDMWLWRGTTIKKSKLAYYSGNNYVSKLILLLHTPSFLERWEFWAPHSFVFRFAHSILLSCTWHFTWLFIFGTGLLEAGEANYKSCQVIQATNYKDQPFAPAKTHALLSKSKELPQSVTDTHSLVKTHTVTTQLTWLELSSSGHC